MNSVLVPHTFSIRDELLKGKESMSILANNRQKHLGMKQKDSMFTGVIEPVSSLVMSAGSNPIGLERWNWVQLKSRSN